MKHAAPLHISPDLFYHPAPKVCGRTLRLGTGSSFKGRAAGPDSSISKKCGLTGNVKEEMVSDRETELGCAGFTRKVAVAFIAFINNL